MKKSVNTTEKFLTPGDFRFETRPIRLRTLLGSCVAFTWWHPQRKIGGMCHFMLPSRARQSAPLNGKYGDEAIELFIREARAHNTQPQEYQIKMFGGGEMFPHHRRDLRFSNVAQMNVNAALKLACHYGLDVIAQDVGRTGYRTVIFDLWNGHVWVRHQPIRTLDNDAHEKNKRAIGR